MRLNIAYLSLFVAAMSACSAASYAATPPANSSPRQRVVISDDYTSWLLKGEGTERYGDGEAKVAQAGGGSIWLDEVHRYQRKSKFFGMARTEILSLFDGIRAVKRTPFLISYEDAMIAAIARVAAF